MEHVNPRVRVLTHPARSAQRRRKRRHARSHHLLSPSELGQAVQFLLDSTLALGFSERRLKPRAIACFRSLTFALDFALGFALDITNDVAPSMRNF